MAERLKLDKRRCLKCGKRFTPVRRRQRFDSDLCRMVWHTEQDRLAREAFKG